MPQLEAQLLAALEALRDSVVENVPDTDALEAELQTAEDLINLVYAEAPRTIPIAGGLHPWPYRSE